MNIQKHTAPENLEKYAFYWSELRLVLGAIALLIGGTPLIMKLGLYGFGRVLGLCWIISGMASGYLLYRWFKNGKMLFGKKSFDKTEDKGHLNTIAFLIMIVSGFNLGITGLVGTNIGMNISSSYISFVLMAVLYIFSGLHLWKQWKNNGKKIF